MKFPFFASFIIFCLWLGYEIKKNRKAHEKNLDAFWEKEAKANNTRKKSLEGLNYIKIPFDSFPMELLCDDPMIREYHDNLYALDKEPVVNLSGISNTDLKLEYGAPNIKLLSAYDQRYTTLARTLQAFGNALYEKGYLQEACTVLEFAVSTHTDISATYKLLITLYQKTGQEDKISSLLPVAESLHSGLKNTIVTMIREACRE